MPLALEIDQIAPGVRIWQVYNPAVKADLFSTALDTPSGTYLVDPIGLGDGARQTLELGRKIKGIIMTNENHERATGQLAKRFSVPVYLHPILMQEFSFEQAVELDNNGPVAPGLTAHAVDGAPEGEIALHYDADGGTMVVGDALINFEPHGFALLPVKYCRDFKEMRRSLRNLLDHSFERMLFAHGTPILSRARERLEQLLASR